MTALHETASRNILTYLEEGRLIQRSWHAERDGKEMACLLGAAAGISSASDCPAELMPRWMAEVTVTLFDGVSSKDWPTLALRYGGLVARWSVLSPEAWSAVLSRWLIRVIDQAIEAVPAQAKTQDYWPAIEKSSADCRSAIESGDKDAARAARAAAYAAADAADAANAANAANAAADAARAATKAADAARAATKAANAARAAARAAYAANAANAAYAAYAAARAAYAARAAARAAYKSLFTGLLDEIEREIGAVA